MMKKERRQLNKTVKASLKNLPVEEARDRVERFISSPASPEKALLEHAACKLIRGLFNAWNPDDLITNVSDGIAIYRKMMSDPFVKTAFLQKINAILALAWHVDPAADTPQDHYVASFVEHNFREIEGHFGQVVRDILQGVRDGFSVAEINYRILDGLPYGGKYGLKNVKGKKPENIAFKTDEFNNVTAIVSTVAGARKELDPWKFVHFAHLPAFWEPHGNSDFRAAYRAWKIKDVVFRFLALYLQKYGMPTAIGKYPPGATPEQKDKLLDILKNIQQDSAVTIPDILSVDFLKDGGSSRGEFSAAIDQLNKEILVGITGAYLQSSEGTHTGARNMGLVHQDTLFLFIVCLLKDLTDTINDQIIRRLVDLNFLVSEYPALVFETEADEESLQRAQTVAAYHQMGVEIPLKWLHEQSGIPMPKGDEPVLAPPAPAAAPAPFPGFSDAEPAAKFQAAADVIVPREEVLAFAADDLFDLRFFTRNDEEEFGFIDGAVAQAKKKFSDIAEKLAKRVTADGLSAALDDSERNAIADAFADSSLTSHLLGRYHEWERFCRRTGRDPENFKFSETINAPLPPSRAWEFFKKRIPVTRGVFRKLHGIVRAKAFTLAGDYEDRVIQEVFKHLQKALSAGMTEAQFRQQVIKVLISIGVSGPSPFHLGTIFRTAITQSYAQGRAAQAADPDVWSEVVFEIVVTMLDNAVRDSHRKLHGFCRPKDDPAWRSLSTPFDFGCRCKILYILKQDMNRSGMQERVARGLKMNLGDFRPKPGWSRDLIGEAQAEAAR